MAGTIKDVARLAGVSISTVSAALNNKPGVGEDTRFRIIAVAEKLRYKPNILARGLVTKRSHTIGLVISDIANPFFTKVVRGIEDIANENNFNLILCNTDENSEKESMYLRVLHGKRVDGLIIAVTRGSGEDVRELLREGISIVLLDRKLNGMKVDSVVVDNIEGSYQAVSHLINLGHRRIGIISGPKSIMTGRDRLEGYLKALRHHDLKVDEELIKEGNFKQDGGYNKACEFVEMINPPTAIFVANNVMTLGALRALKERNIKIPHKMAIIGFDDMDWAPLNYPPLTTVSQPTYVLGTSAAKLLIKRINGKAPSKPQEIVLRPKLVIRKSSGELSK